MTRQQQISIRTAEHGDMHDLSEKVADIVTGSGNSSCSGKPKLCPGNNSNCAERQQFHADCYRNLRRHVLREHYHHAPDNHNAGDAGNTDNSYSDKSDHVD